MVPEISWSGKYHLVKKLELNVYDNLKEAKKPMGSPTFIKGHIRNTRWDEKSNLPPRKKAKIWLLVAILI